jgi:GxxExxY protein
MNRDELNKIGAIVLDAAITVHKELGPGLLESAYTRAFLKEFELRNILAVPGVAINMSYKGILLDKIYMIDILVENQIILEIKAVDELHPIHEAQLITYLKLADKRLGYLINFNVQLLKDGFKRKVNNF